MAKKGFLFGIPFSFFVLLSIMVMYQEAIDYAALKTEVAAFIWSILFFLVMIFAIAVYKSIDDNRGISLIGQEILALFFGLILGIVILAFTAQETGEIENVDDIVGLILAFLGFLVYIGALIFVAILYAIVNGIPLCFWFLLTLLGEDPDYSQFEVVSFDGLFNALERGSRRFFGLFGVRTQWLLAK